jgi:ketosteroid isomerase-like protein
MTRNCGVLAFAVAALVLGGCGGDSTSSQDERTAAQIDIVRQRIAATNAKDWSAWEALHAPAACRTAPELEGPLCGRAEMRAAIEALSHAFPDYRLELVDAFGMGARLAVRMHTTGTNSGPIVLGDGTAIPPTGHGIAQDWVALVTFDEAGLIVRFEEFYDQYVLLVQLGLAQPL